MPYIDFVSDIHKSTSRDYLKRVTEHDKAECAEVAFQWGKDYWDGDRRHGYGGFHYDGRWRPVAEKIVEHYQLSDDASILDVGCGKAFLLFEMSRVLPRARVAGIDISSYAIQNAKEEIRPHLRVGSAEDLPYEDRSFDLVISINTLHNLMIDQLWLALAEIERVARGSKYVTTESYRNEREKVNLLYWQLTCRSFYSPSEWEWVFRQAGYCGDFSFIYFQ
jgi:protein-L-isoaspartate(D-aspartate) O-methyltransferase